MVVIQQVYDRLATHPKPQLRSQCHPNRDEAESLISNPKRSPAGILCAATRKAGQEDRKHKHVITKARGEIKDKSCDGDGSCCSLRHDGHFAPSAVRPKPVMKLKQKSKDVVVDGKNTARCGCCRHASSIVGKETSKSPCVGDGDGGRGDVEEEEEKGGLRCKYKGAAEVRLRDQAEWFDSSFNLLTIEPRMRRPGSTRMQRFRIHTSPRKLRTRFSDDAHKYTKPAAAAAFTTPPRAPSPCLSLDDSLDDNGKLHLDGDRSSSCNSSSRLSSPPDSPPEGPREQSREKSRQESCDVTYEDADQVSPRHFGLYEMAYIPRLRSLNKFSSTGQREDDTRGGCARTDVSRQQAAETSTSGSRVVAEALRDAHNETLEKARNNPGAATRLDNMKASILCHGFYPRLVDAYIRRRSQGGRHVP